MAAVGPGGTGGGGAVGGGDAPAHLARGQLEQADAQVGARHVEAAGLVLDVGRRGFQRLGGQVLGVVHRLLRRGADRRAAGEQRARAGAAEAVGPVGVALQHADAIDGHAEHVHRQLGIAGGDALAHGLGGRAQLDEAVGGDIDRHGLGQRIAAGPFQEGGDAAATLLAAWPRSAPGGRQSRSSRPAPGPGPGSAGRHRCRTPGPSGWCRASAPGGSCCGGAARPDPSSACGRRRPSAARSGRWPRAGRRRGRHRWAWCW